MNPLRDHVRIEFIPHDADFPGGRHIEHDDRSIAYARRAPVSPVALGDVDHAVHCDTLDQGRLGSCVGNASEYAVHADPVFPAIPVAQQTPGSEDEAVSIYEQATQLDNVTGSYPPDDTGSSGLAGCKALLQRGLIAGYQACLGIDATLAALQDGPVDVGLYWLSSFDEPDSEGIVRIAPGARVRGGHEICFVRYNASRGLVGFNQSWGPRWGDHGRGQMPAEDLATMLDRDGDAYALVPLGDPAPTPEPPPPTPPSALRPASAADWRVRRSVAHWLKGIDWSTTG